jgi:hypothetical protein
MTEEKLYTMKEAADRLRLSINRLRTLITAQRITNTLQHGKGTRILIPQTSIENYLKTK